MALAIGSRVGPYQITAEIGAGGMGVVYRAHDSRLGRGFDVTPDGQLLMMMPTLAEGAKTEHTLMFVQNFFDELRRRVPIGKP
jgi:hypothetical protein